MGCLSQPTRCANTPDVLPEELSRPSPPLTNFKKITFRPTTFTIRFINHLSSKKEVWLGPIILLDYILSTWRSLHFAKCSLNSNIKIYYFISFGGTGGLVREHWTPMREEPGSNPPRD